MAKDQIESRMTNGRSGVAKKGSEKRSPNPKGKIDYETIGTNSVALAAGSFLSNRIGETFDKVVDRLGATTEKGKGALHVGLALLIAGLASHFAPKVPALRKHQAAIGYFIGSGAGVSFSKGLDMLRSEASAQPQAGFVGFGDVAERLNRARAMSGVVMKEQQRALESEQRPSAPVEFRRAPTQALI